MCFIDITDSLILLSYNFQYIVCHNKLLRVLIDLEFSGSCRDLHVPSATSEQ